jgi:hypothetical protein
MTPFDFDSEVKYRAALSIIRSMLEKGWLTTKEFTWLNRQLVENFNPIIGSM